MDQIVSKILLKLIDKDVHIWVEDNSIRFNAPDGAMTDEIVSLLKNNKQRIIDSLNEIRSSKAIITKKIKHVIKQNNYDISNAQRRLWVLDQFEDDSITYNMPAAFTLEGKLYIDPFKLAFSYMIERHESLRTVFVIKNGEPRQKILENPNFEIEIIDLKDSPDPEEKARLLAEKEMLTTFHLQSGPLVRFSIIQIKDDKNLLLFNMHHIISDGWSMNIFIREFLDCYHSFREGRTPNLKPLRIHYKDYSAWQKDLLESDEIRRQRDYWLEKLSGELPVLELFSDKIRPASKTFNGNRKNFILQKDMRTALNKLCLENEVSLFMMLQTLVKVLFYRYTGQSDIILGSPVTGRVHEDLEDQIGFYVNTLVFRDTIESDLLFWDVLASIKRTCTEAFDNQGYPFDSIVEDLDIRRDLSRSPLFDIMLVLQNNEKTAVEFEGLEFIPYEGDNIISKFDMTFSFSEGEDRLDFCIEYNSDIYAEDRIERMGEHLKTLISSVIENPEVKVQDLQIIPSEETNLLIDVFNDTKTQYLRDKTIVDLFEDQVEKTPDSIAVIYEDTRLTYRELNNKANSIAHYLYGNYDLKPDDLLGLMFDISVEMVIALLAILKTGAAFVPIDPDSPIQRIQEIINSSNIELVLTDRLNRDESFFLNINKISVIGLSDENLGKMAGANNLAYVIFTSGSTGRPKGVMIEHCNISNQLTGLKNRYNYLEGTRHVLLAPITFDPSIQQIFWPLMLGCELHLVDKATKMNPIELLNYIVKEKIDVLNTVPSLMKLLLDYSAPYSGLHFKMIILAGEVFTSNIYRKIISLFKVDKLLNVYGPTEATINTTLYECPEIEEECNISIGKPLQNYSVWILDANKKIVPISIPGEIYISGAGTARGYINQPELTADRFVNCLYCKDEVMYRTGDYGRWLPDGNIEYLGRIDNQVKIRGFRIELGEIESQMLKHQTVKEAVVKSNDDQLYAYYTVEDEETIEFWPSIGEYPLYDDFLYTAMTNDDERIKKYRSAIKSTVRDKVVVEIGTGKDLVLAKMCCDAGAKKVYAIEVMDESYKKAQVTIKKLGLEDKIILVHGLSTDVELPELADVCVSQIIGTIGGSEGTAAILNDARRFLRTDGIMIPDKCITKIAAVGLPKRVFDAPVFSEFSAKYTKDIFDYFNKSFDVRLCIHNLPLTNILSSEGIFEDLLFYEQIKVAGKNKIKLTINKDGLMDGFLLWINLYTNKIEFINNLGEDSNWLPVYIPIFKKQTLVKTGDEIIAECSWKLSNNGINPDYFIEGTLFRENKNEIKFFSQLPYFESSYRKNAFYKKIFQKNGISQKKSINKFQLNKEINEFITKTLPYYMLPSHIISLKKIPLTHNGKIDRKALPEPDGSFSNGIEYIAPRNEIQEKLVLIWQEVLGIERIGILDNFLELGGHSLNAIRVLSQIMKELEVDIALREIFESQTVEALSSVIENARKKCYKQIEVATEQEYYDISNAQRRLWILDQFEQDSITYNMPAAFILEGKLKVESFRQAYSYMVERHESLRTVFVTKDGEPKQKILKSPGFKIEIIDLRNSHDVEKEAEILAEKNLKIPFNLEVGPLVCFTLIQLEDEKHVLLFNMHHIISDGWSMGIFISEFLTSYNSFKDGISPELTPLRIHYKDYSAWQNSFLDSSEMDSQREYWLDKLSGDLPVLDLPTDNIRPVNQTYNGKNIDFVLPGEINSGLNDLCLENKTSFFMMLQALVKVLFHRYTGQEDIILGSPIAGRVHKDLENQIGSYVNILSLRDTIEGDLSFEEILASVKETCTDAFDNQVYPFDRLVEELDIKRDLSRSPLFDVMLILQNNETAAGGFDGLNLSPYNIENTISKFDMTFNFSESSEGLFCGIGYNTDIYSEDRIIRMAEHLKILISSVIENPESRIKDFNIIPAEEKNLLLNVFNDTKADYPENKTIIDLFEEQVEKTPNNIAVVFENAELTYFELNEKANVVGHYLRDNYKIEPDDLVGVLLKRSEKMIIALLGILKSGAAYVPLDPEYPEERIEYMLKDSCPKIVLSERDSAFDNDINFIDINDVLESDQSVKNPGQIIKQNNLAYIIYTSGSTGKPKGVVITHSGVMNTILDINNRFDVNENDKCLAISSLCFDLSVYDIFGLLGAGGTIVIPTSEECKDPAAWYNYLIREKITLWNSVPAFMQILVEYCIDKKTNLSKVLLSGDWIPLSLPDKIKNLNDGVQVISLGGATEASIWSIYYPINKCEKMWSSIPYGKPLNNQSFYILDRNMELSPVGVAGDIYIGGDGLAKCYMNRPELTEISFVNNPFTTGERIYKTGDQGRWFNDGNIEFLGRIDNQVKIRGFRIELGEIENSIVQHKDINFGVVIVKEAENGDKQLIAYYVSDKELELSGLRSFLKRSLPDYMIPSLFIYMETLPLTPNGKVDRKALPKVDVSINSEVEYVSPRNEIEKKLVEIWQEVLGIKKLGIYDSFFDLGGHSLTMTKVIFRINQMLDIEISMKTFFENNNISELAIVIDDLKELDTKEINDVLELFDIMI